MKPEYDQTEVAKAFHTIKAAMKKDCPEEPGSYAHSWHCNIAMAVYDSFGNEPELQVISHEAAHSMSNEAASRFMKLCFDVDTKQPKEAETIIAKYKKALLRITQDCTARKAVMIAKNALQD